MNLKGILAIGAAALITLSAPAAYAGFQHRHFHHSNVVVGVGFGGFGFPGWGWGYGYPYYGYYPYGYGYYPYGYYPYGYSTYGYGSYPYSSSYSYGYSSYRPTYGGRTANTSVVVQVQQRLARAGYYRGRVDGVMGSQTRSAIRAYQRAHNMRADGVISDQFLGTMGLR
jgi:Putative peptidoglycan binding domain